MKNFFKDFFSVKMIALNAIIAAIYAVLTIASGPLSYNYFQLRVSEFLNLLVFFNPSYTLGLTIGCLIANLASFAGIYDIIFGTLATLVSCLLMIPFAKLTKNLFFATFIPSLINAITVPFIIYLASLGTGDEFALTSIMYFTMFGWTFLGEFLAITILGYVIFMPLMKKVHSFPKLINARTNLDFKW